MQSNTVLKQNAKPNVKKLREIPGKFFENGFTSRVVQSTGPELHCAPSTEMIISNTQDLNTSTPSQSIFLEDQHGSTDAFNSFKEPHPPFASAPVLSPVPYAEHPTPSLDHMPQLCINQSAVMTVCTPIPNNYIDSTSNLEGQDMVYDPCVFGCSNPLYSCDPWALHRPSIYPAFDKMLHPGVSPCGSRRAIDQFQVPDQLPMEGADNSPPEFMTMQGYSASSSMDNAMNYNNQSSFFEDDKAVP
ncbi:hypothetical protein CPB84DRAFT_1964758 [Gymnopilus junonius]|uniref:Uncharacterized protein n=1 Tax=Gymnopilus junonius TaxID=109634 RepID=A0A9P5NIH1_GYMJU|nr:hypothetical protein CPB84DRAFT_1964758 [Gymnopilus junonius]